MSDENRSAMQTYPQIGYTGSSLSHFVYEYNLNVPFKDKFNLN